TFRRTDPVYTLDLSEPSDPRLLGELKITGYSAYLHPVGGDLLLGVGQNASLSGVTLGTQVSSFDLSDLSEPKRVDSVEFGKRSRSPVEQDSRTFTYLPERRLAFVPLSTATGGASHLGVVRVADGGALRLEQTVPVPGPACQVRVMPIDGDRVAVVANGVVQRLVDPGNLR